MDSILERIIGKNLYVVCWDHFDDISDIDFESEEQRKEYLGKFEREELTSYFVMKKERCKCCEEWREVSSLGGMHCESAEQALNEFLDGYDEGMNKCEVKQ